MEQNLEPIRSKIYEVRGHKEEFYGLNRNLIFQNGISSWGGTRKLPYAFTQPGFPEDFMFQLTKEEYNSLRCHFGTSNRRGGDRCALPYAFTEQGLAMLSGILDAISEALAELQPREPKPQRRIGFIQEE
ncbi:MAG: ORF6N domain-containing protein [Prevotella sp.]|nr:ORF6N domain-containing protein [Prevotella sp.]